MYYQARIGEATIYIWLNVVKTEYGCHGLQLENNFHCSEICSLLPLTDRGSVINQLTRHI